MHYLRQFLDLFLHIDALLPKVVGAYGGATYALLALVVFCETGLVVTPFLPGDSLLFAAGSLAALGQLDLATLMAILFAATIGGDQCNYWIGRFLGHRLPFRDNSRLFRKAYLDRTQAFYARYGGRAVVLARFAPILRTFAPFVAGLGRMAFGRFLAFSLGGTALWVATFTLAGYFFGQIPVVKAHFTAVILAIIAISLLPAIIGAVNARKGTPAAP